MNQPWCIGLSIFYHRGCPYACCSFPQKQLFKLMQLQITINVLAEKPKTLLSFITDLSSSVIIITDLPFIILPEAAAFPSVWLLQDSLLLNPPIYSRALKMSQPWLIKVIVVILYYYIVIYTRQILHAQEVDVSRHVCRWSSQAASVRPREQCWQRMTAPLFASLCKTSVDHRNSSLTSSLKVTWWRFLSRAQEYLILGTTEILVLQLLQSQ